QRRIFVRYTDKMEIARLSPVENHQGVVAIVEGKAGVELDELLLHLDTLSDPALVLVVDSLQDPQNFGVLLRSAECAGVDGVGIRRLWLDGGDQAVRLPMEGMVSSLNAAAAGTVMLYEALRQRRRDVPPAQTRTPRPEAPAETQENGGWENEPMQAPEDRAKQEPAEPAEAPKGGTDETDQVAPSAEIDAPSAADEPAVAEKPKRKAPAK